LKKQQENENKLRQEYYAQQRKEKEQREADKREVQSKCLGSKDYYDV
jgi:hypothetical protein